MRLIQIKNSYSIWRPSRQRAYIKLELMAKYEYSDATNFLNRSWPSIHIEWWLHNIGYYITLPFIRYEKLKEINLRCKDVDLEERK